MRSVNDIMPMIGARFYTQLDAAQMRNDVIEEDLAKVTCVVKGLCTHLHLCLSVDVKQSNYCAGYSTLLDIVLCWLRLQIFLSKLSVQYFDFSGPLGICLFFFLVHGFSTVLRYNLDFFFLICNLSSRQLQWGKNKSQACD